MKKLMILAASFALAACDHKAPDESDILNGLTDLTGNCELLKVSDVKKLNGRDIGNDQYLVQQEFSASLSPLPEFAAEAKELLAAKNEIDNISKKYTALSSDLDKEQAALEEKLRQEYDAQRKKIDEKYGRNQSDAYDVEVHALNDWERAQAEAIRKQIDPRRAELAPAQSAEFEQHQVQVSKLRTEQDFLRKVRSAYDQKCPGIKGQGRSIALQLLGDNSYSELDAFANGAKKTFTENNVGYVKTERGWMRSN